MVIYLRIYFCIKQMARAKRTSTKRNTTRKTRKCASTRKRTCAAAKPKDDIANDDYEIIIPENLKPKKQSKGKKALKILLGLGGAGAAAALGYAGYKNRDKIKEKGKEIGSELRVRGKELLDQGEYLAGNLIEKGKKYASDKYSAISDITKKFLADKKAEASRLISDRKQKLADKIYGTDYKLPYSPNEFQAITDGRPRVTNKIPSDKIYIPPAIEGWTGFHTTPLPPSYYLREAPLAITSGLEMDVVKELTNIKDDLKRTNRIDPNYLNTILREYMRQALEKDAFVGPYLDMNMEDAMRIADKIDTASDENTIENAKKDLDYTLDTLIGKFFKILRGGH